ncbi:MAG TPA: hypothetical protein VGQ36_08130 [Thermoanaerobaculia bacterium]|jgi:hypothetical protein|nr:hypothetical protein [Thermoanaerobaculia bacterium]
MKQTAWAWLLLAAAIGSGCATTGVPVTGTNKEDPSWDGSQSETATSVANFAGKSVITVAFNDENPSQMKIDYTSTTRKVHKGASLMGWAYSENDGASWKYGGFVTPSDDWPVLWGDPAIVSSGNDQKFVFMSNLAVPKSKMPASGEIFGSLVAHIGGACIARSSNGGKTFALHQCVHNNFEFYDGGSMASSTKGDIYAAFIATDSFRYDIWHAKNENDQFTKLPDPFPKCRMAMHPRIRVGYPTLSLGSPDVSLFVAGQIYDCQKGALGGEETGAYGQIIINRYHNGNWGTPRVFSNASAINPEVTLSDRKLRTGPQFSFDVGAASIDGNDQSMNNEIRMLYTRSDGKRLWVEGSFCKFDLSANCHPAEEWGSTPGYYSYKGDQFTPNVRAFPGFLTIPSAWVGTFVTRDHAPAGNTVAIRRGSLAVFPNGTRFMIGFDFVAPLLVCGDKRGYWGDYDDLQFIGFEKNSVNARFLRTYTDSSAGCTKQWEYTSKAVHVSSAAFP